MAEQLYNIEVMLPNLRLPTGCLRVLHQLQQAGFEAYMIGGSMRDLLANKLGFYEQKRDLSGEDFDFTTNATPEEIMAVFPESFYENNFGTVSVTEAKIEELIAPKLAPPRHGGGPAANTTGKKEKIPVSEATRVHESLKLPERKVLESPVKNFEITTFREGEKYEQDKRHPSELHWGRKIEDDLTRRDFTVNALAVTISSQFLAKIFATEKWQAEYEVKNADYQLIDKFGGMADLQANLIRAIGEPRERFEEDALRMMRAVRLSVQLNFAIEEHTYEAIKAQAQLLKHISGERIRDELLKILASDYPKEGIMLLQETGLLAEIMPELLEMRDVAQSGHHLTDVWIHSLDALEATPNKDPIVRLAVLLHDVGKPATQKMLAGKYTFYNHQVVGAHQAKRIAQRLKLSREEAQRIFILVRQHMFHYEPGNSDASIRRFMRQVGLENLNDILDLREADRLGSNAKRTSWRLEEMRVRMIEQLHQPMQVRDLAIDGHDLMKEFGLKPGPVLGRVLNGLLEAVLEEAALNEREKLLKLAVELLKSEK